MEPHQLYPEIWQDIIDDKIRREQILKKELQQTATDQFKCQVGKNPSRAVNESV